MGVWSKTIVICVLATSLIGCGKRALRIDLVPVEDRLQPQVIESDPGMGLPKVAIINISGLITNTKTGSFLSTGQNPVSDLRETLHAIAADDSVRAVVLRINSPGGTVTASDMMYRDLQAFRTRTHKPVVVSMMDVCASGGYYLSCASDYRFAYPTTITGSIGVIVQTVSIAGTLDKLGISTKALTSGPNKDVGSPLRPMTPNDETMIRHFVDQFYGGFVEIVRASRQQVKESDWKTVTDGRVVSGRDAVQYGLIDEVGDLDAAIHKAKQLAGIQAAKIVTYTRSDEVKGSVYASSTPPAPQINLLNLNVEESLLPAPHPQFLYLWSGQ